MSSNGKLNIQTSFRPVGEMEMLKKKMLLVKTNLRINESSPAAKSPFSIRQKADKPQIRVMTSRKQENQPVATLVAEAASSTSKEVPSLRSQAIQVVTRNQPKLSFDGTKADLTQGNSKILIIFMTGWFRVFGYPIDFVTLVQLSNICGVGWRYQWR